VRLFDNEQEIYQISEPLFLQKNQHELVKSQIPIPLHNSDITQERNTIHQIVQNVNGVQEKNKKILCSEPVEIAKSLQEMGLLSSGKELEAKANPEEEKNYKLRDNYSVLIDDIIDDQESLCKDLPLRKDVINKKILRLFK